MRLWLAKMLLPDGYRIVPLEPTQEMLWAAAKAMSPGARPTQEWVSVREKHAIRYRAMIDAYQEQET